MGSKPLGNDTAKALSSFEALFFRGCFRESELRGFGLYRVPLKGIIRAPIRDPIRDPFGLLVFRVLGLGLWGFKDPGSAELRFRLTCEVQ